MALTKTGTALRILKASANVAEAASSDINLKIEKVIEQKKANAIYFRARAISAGDQGPKGTKWNFNGNCDYFSKKELLKSYASFCGRNLFMNHDTSSPLRSVGKVLDSYPVEDPDTGEFYIECLSRIDSDLHPELAKMILNGDLNSVSMGASCGSSQCSICGSVIHSDQDQKCNHLYRLGQEYDAEVDLPEYGIKKGDRVPSFCINSDLTFSELSIVSVPADASALIKTVIAAFQNKLNKVASKESGEARSIVGELESLLSLLAPTDRDAVKNQICGLPSCGDTKVKTNLNLSKISELMKQAAAYDVLVYVLDISEEDKTLASLDLFNAMVQAGFSTGRTKDGKMERQVFYSALHKAMEKGWVEQVENGVYHLTGAGEIRAKQIGEWMGDADFPGKGKLGPKEEKEEIEDEKLPYTTEPWDVEKHGPAVAEEPKEEVQQMSTPTAKKDITDLLQKLSAFDYERLQEHIASKVKERNNSMDNLKAEVTKDAGELLPPPDMGMSPAVEVPADMPSLDKPADSFPSKDKDSESTELKEEKSDVKKLEEAEKLIKEVKEHEKEEVKALEQEAPKEDKKEDKEDKEEPKEESKEPMFPEASKKPNLVAKFSRKPFLSQSFWTVTADDKPILSATIRDICGDHLAEMRSLVISEEYGKNIIARIISDGIDKVASLLNVKPTVVKEAAKDEPKTEIKTSYEAGEHLVAVKEPIVEKKAGACPCGKEACSCDCILGKECSCKMASVSSKVEVTADKAAEPAGPEKGLPWDKGHSTFASDKVMSDEAKIKELGLGNEGSPAKAKNSSDSIKTTYDVGTAGKTKAAQEPKIEVEAKLEKGEQTLSEAEKGAAYPTGGNKPDLANPPSDEAKMKEVGSEGSPAKAKNSSDSIKTVYEAGTAPGTSSKATQESKVEVKAEIKAEAKLEPGEQTLDKAQNADAPDNFKPKMGTESSIPSDEAKMKEVGRQAAFDAELSEAKQRIQQLEADLSSKAVQLGQEKLERALEAKMIKCRKLVEEMVKKDLLAEDQGLVDKYVKEGQNLLDARRLALKETIDLQLSSFLQMPDQLLKVQGETIARMKKVAHTSSKLTVAPHINFNPTEDDMKWFDDLPWS